MGTPKGLLERGGVSLLVLHLRALCAVADPLAVVLGCAAEAYAAAVPPGVVLARNREWATTGPGDSLRCGLEALDVRGACWVAPVDTPPASRSILEALLAAGPPAVPLDAELRPGHPVLVDAAAVAALRSGRGHRLDHLLASAPRVPTGDRWLALDFDTPEAWQRWVEGGRG